MDVNAPCTQSGDTALMRASYSRHVDVVQEMLQWATTALPPLDVNASNKQGMSALLWAAQRGDAAIVELLLQVPGIDAAATNKWGFSAAKSVHPQVVRLVARHEPLPAVATPPRAVAGSAQPQRKPAPPPPRPEPKLRRASKMKMKRYR